MQNLNYIEKGFTLIEVIVTLAIILIVLSVAYPFFISNLKTMNETEIRSDLQKEAQSIVELFSKKAIEAEKIESICYGSEDRVNEKENIKIKKIVFIRDDGEKFTFELNDKKLKFEEEDKDGKLVKSNYVSQDIEKISIKPLGKSEDSDKHLESSDKKLSPSFKEAKGIWIRVNLKKRDISYDIESKINFRNANMGSF